MCERVCERVCVCVCACVNVCVSIDRSCKFPKSINKRFVLFSSKSSDVLTEIRNVIACHINVI